MNVDFNGKRFAFLSHYDFNLYRFREPVLKALAERDARVYALAPPGPYTPKFKELGAEFVPVPLDRTTFNPL